MTPLCVLVLLCTSLSRPGSVQGWGAAPVPSESECRPYIEKALKEHSPQEAADTTGSDRVAARPRPAPDQEESIEEIEETNDNKDAASETETEDSAESSETRDVTGTNEGDRQSGDLEADTQTESKETTETVAGGIGESVEEGNTDQPSVEDGSGSVEIHDTRPERSLKDDTDQTSKEDIDNEIKLEDLSAERPDEVTSEEKNTEDFRSDEDLTSDEKKEAKIEEAANADKVSGGNIQDEQENVSVEKVEINEEVISSEDHGGEESAEATGEEATDFSENNESLETDQIIETVSIEDENINNEERTGESNENKIKEEFTDTSTEEMPTSSEYEPVKHIVSDDSTSTKEELSVETKENDSTRTEPQSEEVKEISEATDDATSKENEPVEELKITQINLTQTIEGGQHESVEDTAEIHIKSEELESATGETSDEGQETTNEDQLTLEFEAPAVRRPRDHITEILRLSPEAAETELLLTKTVDTTLKELKKLYDAAIKPLEILYKYRDLSNRHFGDPEIFSKPLILFMGPWSGGKSTIVNYLLDNEFKSSSLRTGAEPSPAYFNILMWGEREEVLDGTQLAADWTFSGLQKFGQGLLDRLRGLRLSSPLLQKVNIVEIPGILEIRKQVERLFPFNDACQWFIDRADIIFLVYDPSKLDVGPETEAILDQLKGREYQTRIILNKADQVKPEELMRVQGTLIWNISPLMSSTEPPVMYSTSLWSLPYEQGAPSRLLHAQERAFLRDFRQAVDKRVENKIASARRFAVRVRNHAKMVDCYLTTYFNHKSFFGNKKKVADDIIEHPQNYHIYEGLSTLTNISRYDLPDPEVYRDFFRLNPLYDFQRLSDTCTYFRGCPINRLDVAIAYDLPELVGKYKRQAEKVLEIASANKS